MQTKSGANDNIYMLTINHVTERNQVKVEKLEKCTYNNLVLMKHILELRMAYF